MKSGSKKVKWIMIQAANAAIRTDPRMRTYYERKLRSHHHNVVTHVANKMLRITWHMLHENRLYNERKEQLYQSELKRMTHTAQ